MLRKHLASAFLVPLLLAFAPLSACAAPALSPDQRAINDNQRELVAETCDEVMGLSSGGLYRQQCMDSLARSLAAKAESAGLLGSYQLCHSHGLREGTAAFSTCVLDNEKQGAAAPAGPARIAYNANTRENSESYFSVRNGTQWRREQYACAQIGLTPGTTSFGNCVAGLNAALINPL